MTLDEMMAAWCDDSPTMTVQTSGSTGEPKPLNVEKQRMRASARMTCDFLGLRKGDQALLCLPLDYIAGKMMVVRALTCGLKLMAVPPSGHPLAHVPDDTRIDFAAMVPMQVYNSLQVERERRLLANIGHLIIGGGAVDDRLAERLRDFPHSIWSTYGMTETLSHVAMRKINGSDATSWYTPLPGVRISQDADGCLVIDAPQLCHGTLRTHDIVTMADDGRRFMVLGRLDNVICCGGIKIQAEEVERILSHYLWKPFLITKEKDEKYGEIPVLMTEGEDKKRIEDIISNVLPKYWKPRKIVSVSQLPRTETGKLKRKLQ